MGQAGLRLLIVTSLMAAICISNAFIYVDYLGKYYKFPDSVYDAINFSYLVFQNSIVIVVTKYTSVIISPILSSISAICPGGIASIDFVMINSEKI